VYKKLRIRSAGSIAAANDRLNEGFACVPDTCLVEIYYSSHWVWRKSNRKSSVLRTDFSPAPLTCTMPSWDWRFCHCSVTFNGGLACVPAACLCGGLFLSWVWLRF